MPTKSQYSPQFLQPASVRRGFSFGFSPPHFAEYLIFDSRQGGEIRLSLPEARGLVLSLFDVLREIDESQETCSREKGKLKTSVTDKPSNVVPFPLLVNGRKSRRGCA
jgi:hypothetical protein